MVKKAQSGKPTELVNFSVRLENRQRDVIEQAAEAQGKTAGQFMRDSAVSQAVDVLNAQGKQGSELRELARKVIAHLFHAEAEVQWGFPLVMSPLYETMTNGPIDIVPDDQLEVSSGVSAKGKEALRSALENSGSEFARFLLEEWNSWGTQGMEFTPLIDKKQMLGQGGTSEKQEEEE